MEYRIEYENGNCCNYANGKKDLAEWLKLLKRGGETVTDIKKIYKDETALSIKKVKKQLGGGNC